MHQFCTMGVMDAIIFTLHLMIINCICAIFIVILYEFILSVNCGLGILNNCHRTSDGGTCSSLINQIVICPGDNIHLVKL